MWKSLRRSVIALSVALGVGTCAAASASAQEVQWRLHSVFQESRQEAKYLQAFADRVNAAAKDRLKITVYHAGSLGLKDVDVLRLLPAGAAELWILIPNLLARDAPEIANAYPTGTILRPADNNKAIPVLQEILRGFLTSRGVEVIGFQQSVVFPLAIFCRNTPAATLAELKGKKVRVYSKELVETFAMFGVSAQVISQNDLYLAMNTGVVDCALYGYSSAKTISLQEVTKYASDFIPYPAIPNVLLGNKRAWDSLPKDLQAIVSSSAEKLATESLELSLDMSLEDAAMREFVARGFQVLPPFPAGDRVAFQREAMKSWAKLAKSIGSAGEANRSRLMQALGISE